MLEHLFFFCADKNDTLHTKRSYQRDYLDFIKEATGLRPKVSSLGDPVNWWGKLENIKLEKKLNSKLTSFEISNNLKLSHPRSRLVANIEELEAFLVESKDIFLRHPFERSGRVSFRLNDMDKFEKNKKKLEKILKEQPLLADPFFKQRDWDLGSCLVQNGGKLEVGYQIKNLNDPGGVFRGAVLLQENIQTKELEDIGEAYYSLGARDFIQVDSFSYGAGINWLCEVNYRKTMGHIVHKLNRLCPVDSCVAFLITPDSWIKEFHSHKHLRTVLEDLEGVFPLSPVKNPLHCWLINGSTRTELLTKSRELWALVAKNPAGFPSIFEKIMPERISPEIETPI